MPIKLTAEERQAFKDYIAQRESRGNYSPTQGESNPSMSGKYQFDWGLFGEDIKKVTGVKSREEFLKNKDAQEKFMDYHIDHNLVPNGNKRLDKLHKIHPDLSTYDVLALGHHQGWGNVDIGLKSGNVLDFKDGAGTSTKEYLAHNTGKKYSPTISNYTTQSAIESKGLVNPTPQNFYTPSLENSPNWNKYAGMKQPIGTPITETPKFAFKENFSTPTTPSTNTSVKDESGMKMNLLPFVSNIVNAGMKPGAVPRPSKNNPIALQRVSMDNDRYEIEKGVRSNNQSFDRTLDAQTAAANKQFTLAQRFAQLSQVNQSERNQNIDISNKETMANFGIQEGNNAKMDQYWRDNLDRTNTMKSWQMANIANASDKASMMLRDQKQYDLDKEKLRLIEGNDPYGILKRYKEEQKRYGGKLSYSAGQFRKMTLKPIN